MARIRRHGPMLSGLVAQGLQYGSALLLLPVLFTRLSTQEIGVWYLFMAIQGLALIADFGFQFTFARNIALAHSGARGLQAHGITDDFGSQPNWILLGQVLKVARRVYFGLSTVMFLVLATAGLWYVTTITATSGLDTGYVARSWLIFSFGICLGIYFQWISPLLIGTNQISINYIFLIISRGGFAIGGIAVLLAGGRLTALAGMLVAMDVIGRASVYPAVRTVLRQARIAIIDPDTFRKVFASVWPNASRQGVVGIASFLILRYNAFVIITFFGLPAMASYGVTLQLVSGVQQVALLPVTIMLPQLVAAQVRRDRDMLRQRWRIGVMAYAVIFVIGPLTLVLGGQAIIAMIGGKAALLPAPLLILLCTIMALEGNHMVAASIIMSGNRVPFMLPAIVSGIAVAILSTSVAALGMGLTAVILVQGLVQLAYNNWKWPVMVSRETRPLATENG